MNTPIDNVYNAQGQLVNQFKFDRVGNYTLNKDDLAYDYSLDDFLKLRTALSTLGTFLTKPAKAQGRSGKNTDLKPQEIPMSLRHYYPKQLGAGGTMGTKYKRKILSFSGIDTLPLTIRQVFGHGYSTLVKYSTVEGKQKLITKNNANMKLLYATIKFQDEMEWAANTVHFCGKYFKPMATMRLLTKYWARSGKKPLALRDNIQEQLNMYIEDKLDYTSALGSPNTPYEEQAGRLYFIFLNAGYELFRMIGSKLNIDISKETYTMGGKEIERTLCNATIDSSSRVVKHYWNIIKLINEKPRSKNTKAMLETTKFIKDIFDENSKELIDTDSSTAKEDAKLNTEPFIRSVIDQYLLFIVPRHFPGMEKKAYEIQASLSTYGDYIAALKGCPIVSKLNQIFAMKNPRYKLNFGIIKKIGKDKIILNLSKISALIHRYFNDIPIQLATMDNTKYNRPCFHDYFNFRFGKVLDFISYRAYKGKIKVREGELKSYTKGRKTIQQIRLWHTKAPEIIRGTYKDVIEESYYAFT